MEIFTSLGSGIMVWGHVFGVFFIQENMGEKLHSRKALSRERPLIGFIVMFCIWLNFEREIYTERRRTLYI